jgi:hypothetical protein
MATSSRQAALFGLNDWQSFYQTYSAANFQSYDYETLRKSFIDYLQLYYPETFNDYTESSEFIALLDVMAFMGQGLAFRNDLNSRENFIDTAERRDSVIKLANLVSYTPKRNIAGQGFIKVTSISTTQNIQDINGLNLSNLQILWNDPANPNWLEQFNTIINAALITSQRIGKPGNSQDILGVTTSEYSIQIPSTSLPVVPFNATVDNQNMNFELVSASSVGKDYVYEVPPNPSGKFNILYRNDKLGFGSPNTGFFFYFVQGSLLNYDFTLQQQIANQNIPIGNIQGINNSDTWLYQINANGTRTPWVQVNNVYADAQLQTEFSNKDIFSVTSGFNDSVTYVFGDGVFSAIPTGTFRAYVRSGNALTYVIQPSEMNGISVSFSYIDQTGRAQTMTFGLTLTQTVSTAQARETIASIKQRAPTQYYTQNRMVNGQDYNDFPYSLYSSIIKSKAINRSSVGTSKSLDLLDPTGKFSSINCFGDDGALYQDTTPGFYQLTFNTSSDIIAFFTSALSSVLGATRAVQYYIQYYPRYAINSSTVSGYPVYWNTAQVNASTESGYFYEVNGALEIPQPIGIYATSNLTYLTTGALVQFTAPDGYYFDSSNRLQAGIPGPGGSDTIWVTITNVIGDGSNSGTGNFSNGTGPVTLSAYVPNGVTLTQVIPTFSNAVPTTVIQECITLMELQQNFSLLFDNSIAINQQRWFIEDINYPNAFVQFQSVGNNTYSITYQALTYYFGSVASTRFAFNPNQVVFDPYSGKILQDFVNILQVNSQPDSSQPLGQDVVVNILGQTVQSDGYVDDFQVEVSSSNINNNQLILNPDFFNQVTGYVNGGTNIGIYVFFQIVTDPINLQQNYIIPSSTVCYTYPTLTQIEVNKYQYPVGQLFFAYNETNATTGTLGNFYKSVQDPTVITPSYTMVLQSDYTWKAGRQGLSFQYRHNSNNTTRIDPVTTNIIDLYVVTQAYYTAYTQWVTDITNTVPYPDMPTINELTQEYGELDNYKMLSDALILNSVVFKPLFGPKANSALQATIKVVANATTNASDSEIRSAVLTAMNNYFNINNWNFGDTFYFSELASYLHNQCGDLISSAVLVSNDPSKPFGTLYEINCLPYEIFVNAAVPNSVLVIPANTPAQLQVGYL